MKGREQFEVEFGKLCAKYGLPHAIIVTRDGVDVEVFGFTHFPPDSPDGILADFLPDVIEEALVANNDRIHAEIENRRSGGRP